MGADECDVFSGALEEYLRKCDRVENLNIAIDAREDDDQIGMRDTYDRIIFRRGTHRE